MLVQPPIEKLLEKVDNRYSLTYVVARRARQLVSGANPMAESESPNLVTLACEELAQDKVVAVPRIVEPHVPLRPEVEAARKQALIDSRKKRLLEREEGLEKGETFFDPEELDVAEVVQQETSTVVYETAEEMQVEAED